MRQIKAILANLKDGELISPIGVDGFAARLSYQNQNFGIIFSWGEGWEHLSISGQTRCPSWDEMCMFKDKFFREDEAVMQLHPPHTNYVNCHKFCLHLWRPLTKEIPMPPLNFV